MGNFQIMDLFMNQHTWNTLSTWYLLLPFLYAIGLGICIWYIHRLFQRHLESFDSSFLFALTVLSTALSLCLNYSMTMIIPIIFICIACVMFYRMLPFYDMAFIFWSISIGFLIGMGIYLAAMLTTGIIAGGFVYRHKHQEDHYTLNVRCFDEHSEQLIMKEIVRESDFYEVRTQLIDEQGITMSILVIMKKGQTLLDKLSQIKGVESLQIAIVTR